MSTRTRIQLKFDLSPTLADILGLLADNEVVTSKLVEVELKLTKDLKIAIHRLRRRLEGTGVRIESRAGLGYWLDDASRQAMKDKLAQTVPLGDGGSAAE